MEEFKQGFIEEAIQLVDKLEEMLFNIENTAETDADIQEIFRIMHTIKGSSAMFGFSNSEAITHELENIYDSIRDKKIIFNPDILNLTLSTVDVIKKLLNNDDKKDGDTETKYKAILHKVSFLLEKPNNKSIPTANCETKVESPISDSTTNYYYIFFKPDNDILKRGIAPVNVFEELVDLGQITGFPYTNDVPSPEKYDPGSFFLAWDIFIKTKKSYDIIDDCFMFYLNHEYKIIAIDPENLELNADFLSTCINLNKDNLTIDVFKNRLKTVFEVHVAQTIAKQDKKIKETDTLQQNILKNTEIESIKVNSKKLDELINLVSELVTLNSRLEIQTEYSTDEKLKKTIKSVSKLSKRFRDNALELRLIPVKVLILKLQRLVRDLSKTLNKEIEFITEGTNTELDKNIIAKLEGPLMHILRNSIDHGLESKENRIKADKPAKGVIRFIAFYSGSNVFIQIQDDGAGIDIEKVKQKAIDKKLITKKSNLNKQDIFNLLFAPGFSTAENITNVSGRGVGLDVVKKEISDMRGEIDIESEKGLGTSITLKLPLTLSIIDTLMVNVNNSHILIPREFILQTNILFSHGSEKFEDKIEFDNKVIPVISLRSDFDANAEVPNKIYNVIVKQYDKLYAVQVDKIIGEHQAVVKPLGYFNQNHDYFSGASILGDGSLAFILDVNKVISIKKNKNAVGHYNLK